MIFENSQVKNEKKASIFVLDEYNYHAKGCYANAKFLTKGQELETD